MSQPTSGRCDPKLYSYAVRLRYCRSRHPHNKARLQTQAQLGATMTAKPDSSLAAADKARALEHVQRINPNTDKFEVSHDPTTTVGSKRIH